MTQRLLTHDVLHVIPTRSNGWEVRHEAKAHPHAEFSTKGEAIERARIMAEACQGELVIHRRDFQRGAARAPERVRSASSFGSAQRAQRLIGRFRGT